MKNINKITILFLSVLIISCTANDDNVKYFSRSDFKNHITLKSETIGLDSVVYKGTPINFTLINDSILFVLQYNGNPFFLQIFNLNNFEVIANLARHGNGPNEYLSCRLKIKSSNSDYFYIHDIVKQTASKYHIDSLLLLNEKYMPEKVSLPRFTSDFLFINDSIWGYNNFYFNDKKIYNDVNALYKMHKNDSTENLIDINNVNYFTANVSDANIYFSPKSDYLWVVDRFKDKFDIYDRNLNISKTLIGPDIIQPEYEIRKENHVSFKNTYNSYLYYGFGTDSHIFLLYYKVDGESSNYSPDSTEIFQFTWDGELVNYYTIDKLVMRITYDENKKVFYASYAQHWFISEITKLIKLTYD